MSDEAVNETTQVEGTETASASPDALPEWARAQITKANNEAAKYRTKAKETEERVRFEVESEYEAQITALSDERAAIAADLNAARLDGMRLRAALAAGIPGESAVEFAELLKGETEEELAAHAEKVKGLMGTQRTARVVDRSQGLGGGNSAPADNFGAFILNQIK